MFKSIEKALHRKQELLVSQSSVSLVVKRAVQEYIATNYPSAVQDVRVRYVPEDGSIVITTPSKSLAGELMLNTRELRAYFTAHNVRAGRIIAR